MKQLFACITILAIGTTISFAQSTTTTTTTTPVATTEKVEQATPAVVAVEAQETAPKCNTASGTKSCCSHNTSRTSAVTTPDASSSATTTSAAVTTPVSNTVEATPAPNCHQVSVSVSAAKPEETTKPEDPKK